MKSEHCLYVAGGGISSLIGNTVSGEAYDTVHNEVDSEIDDEVYGTVGDIVGDEVSFTVMDALRAAYAVIPKV